MNSQAGPRRFLFLQGIATLFFARLAQRLVGLGQGVYRVNFNAGDRLFWDLPGAVDYRDRPEAWPAFFEACLKQWGITDLVLFGDWRPLHAQAISIASWRGLRVHVFEEGYVRPHWITLERGGVNRNSSLSRDPEWYRMQAQGLPAWRQPAPIHGDFLPRAVMDVGYHAWRWLMSWRFPYYQSHLPVSPFREYWGWIGRFLRHGLQDRQRARLFQELAGRRFFLYPLQLDTDSQLRLHSDFGRQARAIEAVPRTCRSELNSAGRFG
jgi:capsular polysaccharide export protein